MALDHACSKCITKEFQEQYANAKKNHFKKSKGNKKRKPNPLAVNFKPPAGSTKTLTWQSNGSIVGEMIVPPSDGLGPETLFRVIDTNEMQCCWRLHQEYANYLKVYKLPIPDQPTRPEKVVAGEPPAG